MMKSILHNKQAMLGAVIIVLVLFVALFTGFIAPNDPVKVDLSNKFATPSIQYPLGTDQLGRCELSRLLYGARYSMMIVLQALAVIGVIGLFAGTSAAYIGGKTEQVFNVLCNIFMAFPPMVMAMSLTGALGQGLTNVLISVMVANWAWYAKVVRSYTAIERTKDYITSAKLGGCGTGRILLKHLIPNVIPQFLVQLCTGTAITINLVAGFAFLGLGIASGTPEWGAMMNEGQSLFFSRPAFVLYPGLCILIASSGFNMLGEAMRDILSKTGGQA